MKIKDKMAANVKMALEIVNTVPDGQNLTTAQQAQYDKLIESNNKYQALINDGTVTENDEADRPLVMSRRPDPGQPGSVPDDNRPAVKISATANRFKPKHFKGANAVSDCYSFGRYMMAISGDPGSIGWCHNNGINIYAAASSEGSNALGGYLVPDTFSKTIIDLRDSYGSFRKYARVVPMTSDTLNIPRRATGLTGYWVAESGTITESNKTWNQVALTLRKLAALTRMTNELAEDAILPVADDLMDEI